MVTQVNAIVKAQKNLLIIFQNFVVFSFFSRVFPFCRFLLSESRAFILF